MAAIANPGKLLSIDSSLVKTLVNSRGYGTNIAVSTKALNYSSSLTFVAMGARAYGINVAYPAPLSLKQDHLDRADVGTTAYGIVSSVIGKLPPSDKQSIVATPQFYWK